MAMRRGGASGFACIQVNLARATTAARERAAQVRQWPTAAIENVSARQRVAAGRACPCNEGIDGDADFSSNSYIACAWP